MRLASISVLSILLLGLVAGPALAQEPTEPTVPPAPPEPEVEEAEGGRKGFPFALYVYASSGSASTDALNTSIETESTNITTGFLEIDDQSWTKAAVGMKLPNKKGDVRLVFSGYKEQSYKFAASGFQSRLPAGNDPVPDPLLWWSLNVDNGMLTAERTPPQWNSATDDTNGNSGADTCLSPSSGPDCTEEISYIGADISHGIAITDDLQNQARHVDLLYGREFGGRVFNGRWWGGLRHFAYEGNVLATAWLNLAQPGEGFTDGTTLRVLNFPQKSEGFGPTGVLEARFNFLDDHVALFLQGQVAFLTMSLETDTGQFFTLVEDTLNNVITPAAAQLATSRDKSTWQTAAEAGFRIKLTNGLEFEFAYSQGGYLDVVLNPPAIQIPLNPQEAAQGTSAIYSTQDLIIKGWRGGLSFQF